MKAPVPTIAKYVLVFVAVVASIAFFGYEMYRNMGKGSKASGSGVATITLANSVTGTVTSGSTFTIGVTIAANEGNTFSAADLFFTDPQNALDFVMPDASFPLEDQASKAFDETVRLATASRSDGSVKLERITVVAKRATASLKNSTTLRLRFRARTTTAASYPAAVSFGVNTGSSVIAGPGVNGNSYGFTPANPSLPVTLACSASTACPTGNVCYQSACRSACTSDANCVGLYHCENGACAPGKSGNSSASSSAGLAPTALPGPTATPEKADLLFKVKIPDLPSSIAVAPQVRVIVIDSSIQKLKTYLTLYRQAGTDYFQTNAPLSVDIPDGAARSVTVLVKQQKTIQHSFTATMQRHTTTDCITAGSASCGGSLQNSDFAPLLSGDTDGFMDGTDASSSASFNRIDSIDWQRMSAQYGSAQLPPEPNADFNLDGKIDILDMGILGKNYQKAGE